VVARRRREAAAAAAHPGDGALIVVTGSVVVQDGRLDEALALSLAHVRRSRTEPGCLAHAVHRDVENPSRLVFVEEWADRAALTAHFAVPDSRAFVRALAAIAVEPPVMSIFEAERLRG
jgi:quinol monooxygenase YgiN